MGIRTLFERAVRKMVLKRKLPQDFGNVPFYLTPESQLKYLRRDPYQFEPILFDLIKRFITPDSTVWDIGANVGIFAFAAAAVSRKGFVLAVEADIWLAHLMQKTQKLGANHRLKVEVVPAAVSENFGVISLDIAERGRASNSLTEVAGRSQMGGVRRRVWVPSITLDSLLETFPAPTFVKIDVEGAEWKVLQGSSRILEQVRPVLYLEVGDRVEELITFKLTGEDYHLFDGAGPFDKLEEIDSCSYNTLAVPAEKTEYYLS